jgi:dynactin-4
LSCNYCNWSSKEIGIRFEKPNGIHGQLAKMKNGGEAILSPRKRQIERDDGRISSQPLGSPDVLPEDEKKTAALAEETLNAETQFYNLKNFYQAQLADATPANSLSFSGDYGFGSPSALSRIMGLYTGTSFADKTPKGKGNIMREAANASEGLSLPSTSSDNTSISTLRSSGVGATTTSIQRLAQPHSPHLTSDLRPLAHLLRTKRSKRCRTCRHILSKPESKVQTTRYRIRLIASNYIPSILIKPLAPPISTSIGASLPATPIAPQLRFQAQKPTQFTITLKNPLFDPIKVTLATPAETPGRNPSKVTILCPQFEVGANTDVWDEALSKDANSPTNVRRARSGTVEGQLQGEAGKIWEKGRNWVSVVVEVVPARIEDESGGEDSDVLEIPVFVRVEWEGEGDTASLEEGEGKEAKERKELAYWCVLSVGRIVSGAT